MSSLSSTKNTSPESSQTTPIPFYERVPAHVRYPGMILFFLIGSVCAQMILLRAAISDGGAQIEKNYYQRAVSWEDEQHARQFAAQDDVVDIHLVHAAEGIQITLFKAPSREPIEVSRGEIVLRRPHLSEDVARYDLEALIDPAHPGILTIPHHAAHTPGLWDIVLSMTDTRGNHYLKSFREEW